MGILERVFAASGGGVSDMSNRALWLQNAFAGVNTVSGERVSEAAAESLSTYYACISNIAADLAKLPLSVYEHMEPRGRKMLPDHPVHVLLHDSPNDDMTAFAFRETLIANALAWGNGLAEIALTGGGEPYALYPIHPARVEIKRNADKQIVYAVGVADAKLGFAKVILRQDQVFHIHGRGSDGVRGYAIVEKAVESLGGALATQKFASAYFGNNTMPGIVLEHPGALKPEAQTNLRNSWATIHQGAGKAFNPAILEEGMKATVLSVPPEHAQFIQSREFQVEDICRWFRMPLNKVQQSRRAQGWSTLEQMNTDYVTDTLMPWAVRWEQEVKRKLLAGAKLYAKHTFTALLRADAAQRGEFFTKMLMAGAMSPNDIRELEDMNPIDGGDVYVVPMNVQPLEKLGEEPEPPPPPLQLPPPNPPPVPPEEETEEQAKSYRPILLDAARRVIRKETMAVGRAAKRHAGDLDAFGAWLGKFYSEHRDYLYDAFEPSLEGWCQLVEKPYRPESDWLLAFAKKHADDSITGALAAFEGKCVPKMSADWESVKPEMMAFAVIERMTDGN